MEVGEKISKFVRQTHDYNQSYTNYIDFVPKNS